jgi:ATP adenylyltransferase
LAPALGQKPTSENKEEGGENPNPFLNPNPALVVKELDEHILLLNKFAVIPNHLLIVTKGKVKYISYYKPEANIYLT